MKLSLWIHFTSVLVASVAAAVFLWRFSLTIRGMYGNSPLDPLAQFVDSHHFWHLVFPIPWLVSGLKLSRYSEIPQTSLHIYSASCYLGVVCIFASVLLPVVFIVH
jgi:hypothetical protein